MEEHSLSVFHKFSEENIWTEETGSYRGLEKITY